MVDVRTIINNTVEENVGSGLRKHVRNVGGTREVIIKRKCPQGMRFSRSTNSCVQMTSSQKLTIRIAARKAAKTFRNEGGSALRRKLLSRSRTMKIRQAMLGAS